MELRRHREISEIIFGYVLKGEIDPADVDGRMLVYPYNAALDDRAKGENQAFLKSKYGTDPIDAANQAVDAQRTNGISSEDWLHQLARVYQDFRIVNVMQRTTKEIEHGEDIDYQALKEEIDGRLADSELVPMSWSEIKEEFDHEWIWPAWIPAGELTIMVGNQGAGKSAFALYLADCVANGRPLPDGSSIPEPMGVLWVETEGRNTENFRRARLWAVDQRNIYSPSKDIRRRMDLNDPADVNLVRMHAKRPEVGLVVVDSLGGALMEENDSMAKKVMQVLSGMAQETNTTFFVIHHLRKGQAGAKERKISLDDVRGHSGITQFSPSVLAINYDGNEGVRFLEPLKTNLTRMPATLSFSMGPIGLVWNESTMDQVARAMAQEAAEWIREQLSGGPLSIKTILEMTDKEGYDRNIIKQALHYPGLRFVTHNNERCISK